MKQISTKQTQELMMLHQQGNIKAAAEMAKGAWERPCFPPNLFGASFPRLELPDRHLPWAAVSDKCGAPEWERRELFLCHPRKRRNPIGWMNFLKDCCRIGNWWNPNSCRWSAANRWMSRKRSSMRRIGISMMSTAP